MCEQLGPPIVSSALASASSSAVQYLLQGTLVYKPKGFKSGLVAPFAPRCGIIIKRLDRNENGLIFEPRSVLRPLLRFSSWTWLPIRLQLCFYTN